MENLGLLLLLLLLELFRDIIVYFCYFFLLISIKTFHKIGIVNHLK